MKTQKFICIASFLPMLHLTAASLNAQSYEFTYQGHLADGGAPVTGQQDFEFRLFDREEGGAQVGPLLRTSSSRYRMVCSL
jgi:hypothetical protein